MQVKTISVTYGRKWNLGSFESMHIEASAWADLDQGEEELGAYARLFAEVKDVVKAEAMPVLRKTTARVEEVYAGLPVAGGAKTNSNGGK